jgi:hypothetical protein
MNSVNFIIYNGISKEKRAKEAVGMPIHKKCENAIKDKKFISERILLIILKISEMNLYRVYSVQTKNRQGNIL